MEHNYKSYTKVLPGRVANEFVSLFNGDSKVSTYCARANRVDSQSFEVKYISADTKLNTIYGGEIVFGLESLENIIRKTISSGHSKEIIVVKSDDMPGADKYTVHLK